MSRATSVQNLYDKKFVTFPMDGLWGRAMKAPERTGIWLVYGAEKNGKTWFSLMLAHYLSQWERTLYVSAEEGSSMAFVDACRRAGLPATIKTLHFEEYMPLSELDEKLRSRKAARIVFLDNLTIYSDELHAVAFKQLVQAHKDKLFVFIAHEEKGQPYTAPAKRARKLASIIVQVKGLTAFISGRCPGGAIRIDEEKAALYWGQDENDSFN